MDQDISNDNLRGNPYVELAAFFTDDKKTKRRILSKCNFCDQTFTAASSLKIHSRVHTEIRKEEMLQKCMQCDFVCFYKNSLKQHLRTHSGERPFKCNQCEFASTQSSGLKTHLNVHSGVKSKKM